LSKVLTYYAQMNCPYPILIGDASDAPADRDTRQVVAPFEDRLRIAYRRQAPGITTVTSTIELLGMVSTPYTAWCGDDDYLVPRQLQRCVVFLESHQDYVLACGDAAEVFVRQEPGQHFTILTILPGAHKETRSESPSRRLLEWARPTIGKNTFSVQRTEVIRYSWKKAAEAGLDSKTYAPLHELSMNAISTLQGKEMRLHGLYHVMLRHDQKTAFSGPLDYFHRVAQWDWPKQVADMISLLVVEVRKREQVREVEARRIVEAVFINWLIPFLARNRDRKLREHGLLAPTGRTLRERLAGIPSAREVWCRLRGEHDISLASFLNPRSFYFRDFLPIYRILTSPDQVWWDHKPASEKAAGTVLNQSLGQPLSVPPSAGTSSIPDDMGNAQTVRGFESFRGKRVLITGGAGMLGSSLALRLVPLGSRVTVLDAMLPNYGGNAFNLSEVQQDIRFVQGDIRDAAVMRRCLEDAEYVFNLAAQVSYIDSNTDLLGDLDINARGQITLLEACRATGAHQRVVFASSRFVYGRIEYNPVDEEHPLNCLSVYGIHKLTGEKYHRFFSERYGLPTVSLRIANPYGPRQQMQHSKYGIVNWFIRLALEGRPLTVYGKGLQRRDYVYVDDIANACLLAALNGKAAGQVYNVGSGRGVPFREMAQLIATMIPGTSVVETEWNASSYFVESGDYISDIAKIRRETGWSPSVSLREGIERTVEYYRLHREAYWSSEEALAKS